MQEAAHRGDMLPVVRRHRHLVDWSGNPPSGTDVCWPSRLQRYQPKVFPDRSQRASCLFAVADFCKGWSWDQLNFFWGQRSLAVTLRQLITSSRHKQLLGWCGCVNWDSPRCPALEGFWSQRQFWCECSWTVKQCDRNKKQERSNFRNCNEGLPGLYCVCARQQPLMLLRCTFGACTLHVASCATNQRVHRRMLKPRGSFSESMTLYVTLKRPLKSSFQVRNSEELEQPCVCMYLWPCLWYRSQSLSLYTVPKQFPCRLEWHFTCLDVVVDVVGASTEDLFCMFWCLCAYIDFIL